MIELSYTKLECIPIILIDPNKVILNRAVIISVSVSGSYQIVLRISGYWVSGISKVPDIQYSTTNSALTGLVKYFHTNIL